MTYALVIIGFAIVCVVVGVVSGVVKDMPSIEPNVGDE